MLNNKVAYDERTADYNQLWFLKGSEQVIHFGISWRVKLNSGLKLDSGSYPVLFEIIFEITHVM